MIDYIKKEVDVPECFIYQGRLLYEAIEDIGIQRLLYIKKEHTNESMLYYLDVRIVIIRIINSFISVGRMLKADFA